VRLQRFPRGVARVVVVLAIGWLVATFGFTTVRVEGDSMNPTLIDGERAFVPRYEVWLARAGGHAWQLGDIVYFTPPDREMRDTAFTLRNDQWVIKRVVAVGEAQVRLIHGDVWVDGERLNEPYLQDAPTRLGVHAGEQRVPEGALYVLGDNRAPLASRDSRVFGSVPSERIAGRAAWVVWPLWRTTKEGALAWNVRRL